MNEPKDPKIALEQYRNVLGYLQYENTIYWTRSGFMLVAHSALLGFLTKLMPSPDEANWQSIGLSFGISLFGLALSLLWMKALLSALWWINRWHGILLRLEPDAYGDIEVFRGAVAAEGDTKTRHGARRIAEQVALLFRLVWVAAILYAIVLAVMRWFF